MKLLNQTIYSGSQVDMANWWYMAEHGLNERFGKNGLKRLSQIIPSDLLEYEVQAKWRYLLDKMHLVVINVRRFPDGTSVVSTDCSEAFELSLKFVEEIVNIRVDIKRFSRNYEGAQVTILK